MIQRQHLGINMKMMFLKCACVHSDTIFMSTKAPVMTEDIEAFHNKILSQRYILRMFRLNLDVYKATY